MRILYLMAIDWNWIKQRPQFLALLLNDDHEVDVFYLSEVFQKIQKQATDKTTHKCRPVPAVPLRDRFFLFSYIQKWLFEIKTGSFEKYDLIWLGHPALYSYIPKRYKGRIVYDCMDYYRAMCGNRTIKRTIDRNEKQLVERADLIFASSGYLMRHIMRLGGNGKSILLRNGYETGAVRQPDFAKREKYRIAYIGTVAEWFDLALLQDSLRVISCIEYHILGPQMLTLPVSNSIIYDGVKGHGELFAYSEQMDCLIMPFKVNAIVEAVDPVKLYEYISMGKCIVSVWYKEIERFRSFVYFYRTHEEYTALLQQLCEYGFRPKYSPAEQHEFLEKSSWKTRGQQMKKELCRVCSSGQSACFNDLE